MRAVKTIRTVCQGNKAGRSVTAAAAYCVFLAAPSGSGKGFLHRHIKGTGMLDHIPDQWPYTVNDVTGIPHHIVYMRQGNTFAGAQSRK